jgi:hypothetical protein
LLSGSLTRSIGDTVGTYSYDIGTLSAGDNYTLELIGGSSSVFEILARELRIGGVTVDSRSYDGTSVVRYSGVPEVLGCVDIDGDGVTDDVSLSDFSAFYASASVGVDKLVTLTGVLTGVDAGNYYLSDSVLVASILPCPVSIGGVSALSKSYDGSVSATIAGTGELSPVVEGEDVWIDMSDAIGVFSSRDCGNRRVGFSGFGLSGVNASNYVLSSQPDSVSSEITARVLSFANTISVSSREYNGDADVSVPLRGEFSLSGVISGDDVFFTGVRAEYASGSVGSVKPVLLNGGELAGRDYRNYVLPAYPSLVGEIVPRTLSIVPLASSMRYGDELPVIGIRYDGFLSTSDSVSFVSVYGHPVVVLPEYTSLTCDRLHPIVLSIDLSVPDPIFATSGDEPTVIGNYAVTLGSNTLSVTRRTPVLSDFVVTYSDLTYNGSPHVADVSVASGVVGMGEYTVLYRPLGSPAGTRFVLESPVDAGSYEVEVVSDRGVNYNYATLILDTMLIMKGTLSADLFAFDPASSLPLEISLSPYVSGVGAITVRYDGEVGLPVLPGEYAITIDVSAGSNYDSVVGLSLGSYVLGSYRITIPSSPLAITDKEGTYEVVAGGDFQFTVTPEFGTELEILTSDASVIPVVESQVDGSYIVTLSGIHSDVSIVIGVRTGSVSLPSSVRVWSAGNELHIESDHVGDARIYSLSGVLVESVSLSPGYPSVVRLGVGFYAISIEGRSYKVFIR